MVAAFRIVSLIALDLEIADFARAAEKEGFRFVWRLIDDWQSGENRFDQPGEILAGAVDGTGMLGVCGLNRDPYLQPSDAGRLRHLYVTETARHKGVGTALVAHVLKHARETFGQVRLRTDTKAAAAFYERMGFQPVHDDTASHILVFR